CLLKSVGKKGPNKVIQAVDKELTNRKEELEAGEVFILRRYFSRYFKVPTCSTLTYLYVRTLPRCKRCAQGGV
ncbi:hypothetical protein L249_8985, partial [Ophiocordyceps polyrhachis-furcata BCC 54312]